MWKLIFVVLSVLSSISTFAQDFTLSGNLRDAGIGEELLYATVSVAGTFQGGTTNLYGFYSLILPRGAYQVNCSYVGYETKDWGNKTFTGRWYHVFNSKLLFI